MKVGRRNVINVIICFYEKEYKLGKFPIGEIDALVELVKKYGVQVEDYDGNFEVINDTVIPEYLTAEYSCSYLCAKDKDFMIEVIRNDTLQKETEENKDIIFQELLESSFSKNGDSQKN